jgi:hypothetical protein
MFGQVQSLGLETFAASPWAAARRHLVPGLMAQRVVEALEVIDIDQ